MKKLIRILTLAMIIPFVFVACDTNANGNNNDNNVEVLGNWTSVSNSTFGTNVINAVAFGNNVFVAVGGGGRIAHSADGINWTAVTDSTFGTSAIHAVAFGNGRFIVGGAGGRLAYSTNNGITWTAVASTGFGAANTIYGIAYGNVGGGRWVAVGRDRMAHSTNAEGTSWTGQSSNAPFDFVQGAPVLRDVVFGANRSVLVGATGGQGHGASLAHSLNGINWTPRDMDDLLLTPIFSVCYANGTFVAASAFMMLYSTDGADWRAAQGTPMGIQLAGVASGGSRFVTVGQNGINFQSQNGTSWTSFLNPLSGEHFRDVVFGNGAWVAVGLNGVIAYHVE